MINELQPLLSVLDRVDFSLTESDPYSTAEYPTATIALSDQFLLAAGIGEDGNTRGFVIWRVSFR